MKLLNMFRREKRGNIEDPTVPISNSNIFSFLGMEADGSTAGERVTIDSALGVPSVWAAVNFLSGTLAGLPLKVYRRTSEGREPVSGSLANLLHDAVNDEMSSFEWRKYVFEQVFTHGRSVSFIERAASGRILNIWPLEPGNVTVRMRAGRKIYHYSNGEQKTTYEASEVIDLPFMLKADRCLHRSPILSMRETIGLAQAATKYGSRFFASGGVPPFAIEGPFQSPAAIKRAADDLSQAVKTAAKESRLALPLPEGHTLKPIGADPEKSQLVETQRFMIEQVARIYSMPPTFLQDLTHGTFSNTEQQDLHFVKHTIKRWVEQAEQEINLKLFGRGNTTRYVEFNMDGLLRGDFQTRMNGYAQAIQNAVFMPNEARRRENLPDHEGGDTLMVQGATVPIGQQPNQNQGDSNES